LPTGRVKRAESNWFELKTRKTVRGEKLTGSDAVEICTDLSFRICFLRAAPAPICQFLLLPHTFPTTKESWTVKQVFRFRCWVCCRRRGSLWMKLLRNKAII